MTLYISSVIGKHGMTLKCELDKLSNYIIDVLNIQSNNLFDFYFGRT